MSAGVDGDFTDGLSNQGYWPATAAQLLAKGLYSRVVEICRANLSISEGQISGRLILGQALYYAGQHESAFEEFNYVLAQDPDNLVALKFNGDIEFARGNEWGAIANYLRVKELDPDTGGLSCPLVQREVTQIVKLIRGPEEVERPFAEPLREIPFVTETMGDLYLAQGHNRLAAEVFDKLKESSDNPRLGAKLTQAREQGNINTAG